MSDKKSWFLLLVVLIIVVAAGFMFFNYQEQGGAMLAKGSLTLSNPSAYQAVFLDNNQVYFGKVGASGSDFISLTDIYYLQVNQQIQPLEEGQEVPVNPNISLVKLGGELHGPADEMKINKEHVLLIEDLRSDSNLVAAIEQYKANQAGQ